MSNNQDNKNPNQGGQDYNKPGQERQDQKPGQEQDKNKPRHDDPSQDKNNQSR